MMIITGARILSHGPYARRHSLSGCGFVWSFGKMPVATSHSNTPPVIGMKPSKMIENSLLQSKGASD